MCGRKIYLAGPISDTTFEGAVSWRKMAQKIFKKHGIEGISPMRGKDYFKALLPEDATFNDVYDQSTHAYENLGKPMSTAKAIFRRDRWDVHRCDAVLAHLAGFGKVSIGTVMELAWADAWNKLVIVTLGDGDIHNHGMLIQTAGIIVPTLDEALHIAIATLGE
jgi:nucleoside 2-deoxyribosyltransferase